MKKIILMTMLLSLFSNQVLAYYPSSDMVEVSKALDSLESINFANLKYSKKVSPTAKIEKEILKVQKMSAAKKSRYTKKLIRKTKKNAKRAKKLSKKLLKNPKLLAKFARKIGKPINVFKAQLEALSNSILPSEIANSVESKIKHAGGLVNYLQDLQSNQRIRTKNIQSILDDLAATFVTMIIVAGSFMIGSALLLVGVVVLALGGGATTIIIGGVLLLIGSPFLFAD